MTQSSFTAGKSPALQDQGGWTLAKALAPLLRPWREPRPLYPEELSDHWRRDLGLPEHDGRDAELGLAAWTRLER
jgi:hypothetical protein